MIQVSHVEKPTGIESALCVRRNLLLDCIAGKGGIVFAAPSGFDAHVLVAAAVVVVAGDAHVLIAAAVVVVAGDANAVVVPRGPSVGSPVVVVVVVAVVVGVTAC